MSLTSVHPTVSTSVMNRSSDRFNGPESGEDLSLEIGGRINGKYKVRRENTSC